MSIVKTGDCSFDVSCTVTNSGSRKGDEVVQLYIRDLISEYVAYDSVLRGFERISLEPGESREVKFSVGREELEIMGRDMKWTVEPGDFEVINNCVLTICVKTGAYLCIVEQKEQRYERK